MTYVVTIQGVRPTPRYDEDGWTSAILQEAPATTGPWTTIETFALVPDADPARPDARDLTSDLAVLSSGYYRVIFEDDSGDQSPPTDPVFGGAEPGFRPSMDDVGALIRTRTRDRNGNEVGTFNQDTIPNDDQVAVLINKAVRWIQQRVGEVVPDSTVEMVRDAVAMRTALQIELTYFPEQVATNRSPYQQMKEQFDEDLKILMEAVAEEKTGDEMGSVDEPGKSSYSFPEDAGGMVGWQTVW